MIKFVPAEGANPAEGAKAKAQAQLLQPNPKPEPEPEPGTRTRTRAHPQVASLLSALLVALWLLMLRAGARVFVYAGAAGGVLMGLTNAAWLLSQVREI